MVIPKDQFEVNSKVIRNEVHLLRTSETPSDEIVKDLSGIECLTGQGEEDSVSVWSNPIDCDAEADAIQALRDRGLRLSVQCP